MCIKGKVVKVHYLTKESAIKAWRQFEVGDDTLVPVYANWYSGIYRPFTLRNDPVVRSHALPGHKRSKGRIHVPRNKNNDGLHAYKNSLPRTSDWYDAIGDVLLFGKVVEYEDGYLAEKMVIKKVYVNEAHVRWLRRAYKGIFPVASLESIVVVH